MRFFHLLFICLSIGLASCNSAPEKTLSGLSPDAFNTELDGKAVSLYTLTNSHGMEVCITNYGGRVVSIMVPDRNGKMTNVAVGYDSLAHYLARPNSYGATIGRFANRISDASFTLDGHTYKLDRNTESSCLHGGTKGWRFQVYSAEKKDASTLVLRMDSPDGEMGFPGNIHAEVIYEVTEDNALDISYKAVTDRPTVLSMTNHTFFNLSGNTDREVTDNILFVDADRYTPLGQDMTPTGDILTVVGSGLDFTVPREIREKYDINLVLNHPGDTSIPAASLYAPDTGIRMEVYTDQPGMQVYTRTNTVCLESQLFPDSPNKPQWPSSVLRPGETYRHRCIYKFSYN